MNLQSAFHIIAKPTGAICNLDCTYCYYLEKEKLYPGTSSWTMKQEILERFIKEYIESQDIPKISFAWHGGEPTLLGLEFFKNVVRLQKKYADGKSIENGLQTNGITLNNAWCDFFAGEKFLIGLSIDGPRELHNVYRIHKGGQDSFDEVLRGLRLLKEHRVDFNTLTVVNRKNSYYPLKVYRFLKEIGSGHIQFIPVVERKSLNGALVSVGYSDEASVTPWSVEPTQFGSFLCEVFDEWVRKDVGKVFVQTFEVALENWLGQQASLCVFSKKCGKALAIEHNGDVYSCDHYVYPEYILGNIAKTPLSVLVNSPLQRKFGSDKSDLLPQYCMDCSVRFACNGECPKHRFTKTPKGEEGLNYLCAGYKKFFTYIDPYMKYMANEFRHQRSPANVMQWRPPRVPMSINF